MSLMPEQTQTAQLRLPDGRLIDYEIQRSRDARSLRLKLSARAGLIVVAPSGLLSRQLEVLVSDRAAWVAERLANFDAVRHLLSTKTTAQPEAFNLPALGESWLVEYQRTHSRTVGARTDRAGRIVVSGATNQAPACQAALRRWLARHAVAALSPWLAGLAKQTNLQYTELGIKNQRTRWGSCSTTGRISLNCKLLFLNRDQVRYVMVHELCHLVEPSHSERFWMYLRSLEPAVDTLHGGMHDAWKMVPLWAQRGIGSLL